MRPYSKRIALKMLEIANRCRFRSTTAIIGTVICAWLHWPTAMGLLIIYFMALRVEARQEVRSRMSLVEREILGDGDLTLTEDQTLPGGGGYGGGGGGGGIPVIIAEIRSSGGGMKVTAAGGDGGSGGNDQGAGGDDGKKEGSGGGVSQLS